MSGINGVGPGLSNYGQLQVLLTDNLGIRQKLTVAQEQASSGLISQTYAGLGANARTSLDLRPQILHEQTWQSNIDAATGRLSATQTALAGISSIASNILAQTASLNGLDSSSPTTVANLARQGLEQVAQLLNTRVGDVYVFAGQDSANAPLPDTSSATLAPALLASDTAVAPFSTTLGGSPPTVQVGQGASVQIGLLANKNTLVTSAPPSTGSYMRDILRELAVLTTVSTGPTLQATAADARTRLRGAISAIATETGSLGNIQSDLERRKTQSAATVVTLQTQVSGAQDVDMAATLSRMTALQAQLQSSYQIIASLRELTLSKYI